MKFKIEITKIEESVPYKSREWKRLREDETNDPTGKNEAYGYVTEEGTKTVTTTVLEQTVDDLDMAAVIKAINKL